MTYEVVKKEIRKGVEHKEYNLFDTRTQANKYLKTVVKIAPLAVSKMVISKYLTLKAL